ncbi:MAG: energy transducer TonB [Bacteroidaceae bacterium]|nr:energy transducer TonB [Bacteroidaceae bacterium]
MAYLELLSKEWCELIFYGRNKAYGAYAIRKNTGSRYARAFIIVVIVLLIIVGGFVTYNIQQNESIEKIRVSFSELQNFKAINVNQPNETIYKPANTRVTSVIDVEVPASTTEIETTQLDKSSPFITETENLVTAKNTSVNEIVAKDTIPVTTIKPKEYSLLPTDVVEQMPEFPGGIKALMKWLEENLMYPEDLVDMKIQGVIEVSFWVDSEGNVLEPRVSKNSTPQLEQIVLSTIKEMPKWKPGKWKGDPVTVCVTLPIRFQL